MTKRDLRSCIIKYLMHVSLVMSYCTTSHIETDMFVFILSILFCGFSIFC